MSDLGKFDSIYISHIHKDHCFTNRIKILNKSSKIIVMDRIPKIINFMTNFLKKYNLGFLKNIINVYYQWVILNDR